MHLHGHQSQIRHGHNYASTIDCSVTSQTFDANQLHSSLSISFLKEHLKGKEKTDFFLQQTASITRIIFVNRSWK